MKGSLRNAESEVWHAWVDFQIDQKKMGNFHKFLGRKKAKVSSLGKKKAKFGGGAHMPIPHRQSSKWSLETPVSTGLHFPSSIYKVFLTFLRLFHSFL